MSHVFVVDTNKHPLDPIHPARARLLLSNGQAAVFKLYPFTLILKTAKGAISPANYRVKIDPGSKTTGIAIVNEAAGAVVFAAELSHRGGKIKAALSQRRAIRRSRRHRKTRYRAPRFHNRPRTRGGWLPPSLQSRLSNVLTWINKLKRLCPLTAISLELVKFDPQLLDNPDITGVQYQQGELQGDEIRAFLLEKWGRACAYCQRKDVPLQVEHMVPRATGTYIGRVAVRASGSFDITTKQGKVTGIGYRSCRVLQKRAGYSYWQGDPIPLAQEKERLLPPQA